jgi:hypothetical protein
VVTHDAPDYAQVRTLETLTRTIGRTGMSISGFICGIVYPPSALRPPPDCGEIAPSFYAAGDSGVWSKEVQALSRSLGPGSRAIIAIAWRRAAAPAAACLQNYDSVVRIVLAVPLADALLRFMFAELEI